MSLDLEQIKTAALAATPGPWHVDGRMVGTLETTVCLASNVDSFGGIHDAPNADANACQIAAANPAVVLGLIERLEQAEQRASEMEARYDRLTLELAKKQQQLNRAECYAAPWLSLSLPDSNSRLVGYGLDISPMVVSPEVIAHVIKQPQTHGAWSKEVEELIQSLIRNTTYHSEFSALVHASLSGAAPPEAAKQQGEPSAEELPKVVNTLGGFRGGFIGVHGRPPTEQEIWNAGVRSGIDRTAGGQMEACSPQSQAQQGDSVVVEGAPQQPGSDVPRHLLERLRMHANDKQNTAFARSTMREASEHLTAMLDFEVRFAGWSSAEKN